MGLYSSKIQQVICHGMLADTDWGRKSHLAKLLIEPIYTLRASVAKNG